MYLTKIAGKLAPLLRLDPIKRSRLALTLDIAGIPLTPECYTMKAFLTAAATGLLSVPFFMIMPLMGLLIMACTCDYQKESGCGDFLFIPGHDCRPVLLPLSDAENFMGTTIDRTDCSCIMDSRCFIRLYNKWIELATASSKDCPIHQILHLMNRPPVP